MANETRNEFKEIIVRSITNELRPNSFQKRPYFPDLLRQPDLLVVPEPGKLLAIFIYQFAKNISWQATLASLEDLFEVKLHVGSQTIACAVVSLNLENREPENEKIELLRNTFDGFVLVEARREGDAWGDLVAEIRASVPKDRLASFLRLERGRSEHSPRQFSENSYRALTIKKNVPVFKRSQFEDSVSGLLAQMTKHAVVRNPHIRNVKGELASLPGRFYFEFDLGFEGRPDIAIELIQAGKHGVRERLRSLMTKGRLLGYEFVDRQLQPRPWPLRLILIIDGNVAGPDHDPYRYVRSLLSVGWDLIHASELEQIRELLGNENL